MTGGRACIPGPAVLWRSFAAWVWVLYLVVILAALPHLLVQYWFNQSLGFRSLFWTNLRMQAVLFCAGGLLVASAVAIPVRIHAASAELKRAALHVGIWLGLAAGWLLAGRYEQCLLALYGVPFGDVDPVFAHDVGFYVYSLPAIRLALVVLETAIVLGLAAVVVGRYEGLHASGIWRMAAIGVRARLALLAPPAANALFCAWGGVEAARAFLSRYDLLVRNNEPSGVRAGAEYLDVVGVLSSLNLAYVNTAVVVALTVAAGLLIRRAHETYGWLAGGVEPVELEAVERARPAFRRPVRVGAALLALQACFASGVALRDIVFVVPNEPYIQLDYIRRHIEATTRAYQLDRVEVHDWSPPARALTADALLASRTVQNAPVLPSWVSRLEEPPDRQHYERIRVSGSKVVFGPLLDIFQQQQRLRPYYDFLSVDGVRYTVDGEKRMFASAAREVPSLALVGPKEWLQYWGSAALQFTHGMGLVMSPTHVVDEVGAPTYAVRDVPPASASEAFRHEPRIYFGEGAKDDYVLTGAAGLREFDYAAAQTREEFTRPPDVADGIPIDSWLKRLVLAAYTRDVTALLFSRYIDPGRTRVHIRRTPVARARSLAPFLFLDTNAYAFIADGRVLWMVNALTTSDQYPYSFREVLGDKADERAVEEFPERVINYAEDAVKITIDAYSGQVRLYRVSDGPIVRTWERVYPDLFTPRSAMPPAVAAQLTYPLQWFHIQFDDIYKRYHQRDPIQFYNVEDLWDDADETLGSLGRGLSGFGTGDQMTFSYEGYNALLDPADLPDGVGIGAPGDLQFALLMPFTPESARNLRALVIALQDPGAYGRLISLQIPQGQFVPGPEQIDAYIDNDRPVHQQVTMWIRHASEVIRGSTLLLPVKGDLIYLETVWVNSIQNPLPQLKLVAARYRDRITSGPTVAEAIGRRRLIEAREERLADARDAASEQDQEAERDGGRGQRPPRADSGPRIRRSIDAHPASRLQPEQARERPHR